MRRIIFPLLASTLALTACVSLETLMTGSGSSSSIASSVAPHAELQVEIEEVSSSSVVAGTGALAERMIPGLGMLEIGVENSPLLLTIYTNYGCDYCNEFMRDQFPKLETEFMTNGTLRVQFVIVPLKKYPNSVLEASALICATAMDKGRAMDEAIRNANLRDRKSILALAKKIGLSVPQFTTCLGSKETKDVLNEQQTLITGHAITLIPTLILNGEQKTGLPSYADLRGWIREQLAR